MTDDAFDKAKIIIGKLERAESRLKGIDMCLNKKLDARDLSGYGGTSESVTYNIYIPSSGYHEIMRVSKEYAEKEIEALNLKLESL
jgi:hypothetical protein